MNKVSRAENEKFVGRSLVDIATELGVHPTDAMIDIAMSEDLTTEFLWRTETQLPLPDADVEKFVSWLEGQSKAH